MVGNGLRAIRKLAFKFDRKRPLLIFTGRREPRFLPDAEFTAVCRRPNPFEIRPSADDALPKGIASGMKTLSARFSGTSLEPFANRPIW